MIKTGLKKLDQSLDGGIKEGLITDVYGQNATGKTQLTFQICINAIKNEKNVLFQDTTGNFRPERLIEYMQNLASIAINAKIPIVVTNSIRTFDENEKENLEKSINLFSHIKIRLTKNQGSYFCEVISPFINNKFQFNITTNGLTDES